MTTTVKQLPVEERHHLSVVQSPKTNEQAIKALEQALEYAKEHNIAGVLIGVLEHDDVLTVFRDHNLPIYETLGLVEFIRKHVSDDIGTLVDLNNGAA